MGEGPGESRRRLVGIALTWRLRSDSGSKARALRQREKREGWALAGPGKRLGGQPRATTCGLVRMRGVGGGQGCGECLPPSSTVIRV